MGNQNSQEQRNFCVLNENSENACTSSHLNPASHQNLVLAQTEADSPQTPQLHPESSEAIPEELLQKHLEAHSKAAEEVEEEHHFIDSSRVRLMGNSVVKKDELEARVSNGQCFLVKATDESLFGAVHKATPDLTPAEIKALLQEANHTNWLCQDDLDHFWNDNCFLLQPFITSCLDQLALAKIAQDKPKLEQALQKRRLDQHHLDFAQNSSENIDENDLNLIEKVRSVQPDYFYRYDHLGRLFKGECVMVDHVEFCPSDSMSVSELDSRHLGSLCSVFDDVVLCQHDIEAAFQGGSCFLAGLTWVCRDQIPDLLQTKCLPFAYESEIAGLVEARVCGRKLANFLNGKPFKINHSEAVSIKTANDIETFNSNCLTVDGFNVCWESVVKPYDFMDQRCRLLEGDIFCYDHIEKMYADPAQECVRYQSDWICKEHIQKAWNHGGCFQIGGHRICGRQSWFVAVQKCVDVGNVRVCPNAHGALNASHFSHHKKESTAPLQ